MVVACNAGACAAAATACRYSVVPAREVCGFGAGAPSVDASQVGQCGVVGVREMPKYLAWSISTLAWSISTLQGRADEVRKGKEPCKEQRARVRARSDGRGTRHESSPHQPQTQRII
eukprot:6368638-Prymnesium_polylepis.3